jgi:hypothetical protein
VTAADECGLTVVANCAAAVACAFDFDFDPMLAQRALSDGVVATALNVARSAWEHHFGA